MIVGHDEHLGKSYRINCSTAGCSSRSISATGLRIVWKLLVCLRWLMQENVSQSTLVFSISIDKKVKDTLSQKNIYCGEWRQVDHSNDGTDVSSSDMVEVVRGYAAAVSALCKSTSDWLLRTGCSSLSLVPSLSTVE